MDIPEHLTGFPWYARHLAWLNGDPGGERADLAHADLTGKDLSGANLSHIDFTGAILASANLSDANLTDANLTDANLNSAYLMRVVLDGTNISGTRFDGASLADAEVRNLAGKGVASRVECIANLDAIRERIIERPDSLIMSYWHGPGWSYLTPPEYACATTHCLAGWAQALCLDQEVRLLDPLTAGVRLIPLAAPLFWNSIYTVRNWLKNREYDK